LSQSPENGSQHCKELIQNDAKPLHPILGRNPLKTGLSTARTWFVDFRIRLPFIEVAIP